MHIVQGFALLLAITEPRRVGKRSWCDSAAFDR
jgi:hypothetical protein